MCHSPYSLLGLVSILAASRLFRLVIALQLRQPHFQPLEPCHHVEKKEADKQDCKCQSHAEKGDGKAKLSDAAFLNKVGPQWPTAVTGHEAKQQRRQTDGRARDIALGTSQKRLRGSLIPLAHGLNSNLS